MALPTPLSAGRWSTVCVHPNRRLWNAWDVGQSVEDAKHALLFLWCLMQAGTPDMFVCSQMLSQTEPFKIYTTDEELSSCSKSIRLMAQSRTPSFNLTCTHRGSNTLLKTSLPQLWCFRGLILNLCLYKCFTPHWHLCVTCIDKCAFIYVHTQWMFVCCGCSKVWCL